MQLKPAQIIFLQSQVIIYSHLGFHNSSLLLQSKIVHEHLLLLKNFVDQLFQLHNLGLIFVQLQFKALFSGLKI